MNGVNQLCSCNLEAESTTRSFLHCSHYYALHTDLMNVLKQINKNILNLYDDLVVQILLFGDLKYKIYDNCQLLIIFYLLIDLKESLTLFSFFPYTKVTFLFSYIDYFTVSNAISK